MHDRIIVGAGVHGLTLALWLVQQQKARPEDLLLLDAAGGPLAAWSRRAAATGMSHLRSPVVHHLGADPYALLRFARGAPGDGILLEPYKRPHVSLFAAHTARLLAETGLDTRILPAEARALRRRGAAWVVETDRGALDARRVTLAPGPPPALRWPDWAQGLPRAQVQHIFDPTFSRAALAGRVAVVGGGISAFQLALSLAGTADPVLVQRRPTRVHTFDADPGWLGPKYQEPFLREPDLTVRRRWITQARYTGSVPEEVDRAARLAHSNGRLTRRRGEVQRVDVRPDGRLTLHFTEGPTLAVDQLVLATGFAPQRPGGALVDALVAEAGLPVAPCGGPRLDGGLRWAPGLTVMGGLAELQVGPIARNIAGARVAAARILAAEA